MSADEGAARRVAGAIAAQDPLLARDVLALVYDYFAASGVTDLTEELDPMYADPGTEDLPRVRRLHAFGAALASEVGDERAEHDGPFVVGTHSTEFQGLDETGAREAVRDYVREHGEDATRRDVEVFLRIAATGTSHSVVVDRFFD